MTKENETKEEKFKRIVEPRAKKIIYELNRVEKMASQPSYDITDVDAQKVFDAVTEAYESFAVIYEKLASGQKLKKSKKEIADIF